MHRSCNKPHLIESMSGNFVTNISCGSAHSAAIVNNRELYTWGLGDYGRLGHGDKVTQLKPKWVSVSWKYCVFRSCKRFIFVILSYRICIIEDCVLMFNIFQLHAFIFYDFMKILLNISVKKGCLCSSYFKSHLYLLCCANYCEDN